MSKDNRFDIRHGDRAYCVSNTGAESLCRRVRLTPGKFPGSPSDVCPRRFATAKDACSFVMEDQLTAEGSE